MASGKLQTYRKKPRARSRLWASTAIPSAIASSSGMMITSTRNVLRTASPKSVSRIRAWKLASVQLPAALWNATPNAPSAGQNRK